MQSSHETEKKLPKLIFGEYHWEAFTEKIFTKLLPKLQQLGYTGYFSETHRALNEELQEVDSFLNNFLEQQIYFSTLGLDIFKIVNKDVQDMLLWLPYVQIKKEFLQSLVENNLTYRAIDLELDLTEALNQLPQRDAAMSKAYLDESKPVFGNIGLFHLEGIQEHFIKTLGLETAAREFIFISLCSKQSLSSPWQFSDEDNIKPDAYIRKFEGLSGNDLVKSLPLPCTSIDPTTMSDDQICAQIHDAIEKHMRQSSVAESKAPLRMPYNSESKMPDDKKVDEGQTAMLDKDRLNLYKRISDSVTSNDFWKDKGKVNLLLGTKNITPDGIKKMAGIVKGTLSEIDKLNKILAIAHDKVSQVQTKYKELKDKQNRLKELNRMLSREDAGDLKDLEKSMKTEQYQFYFSIEQARENPKNIDKITIGMKESISAAPTLSRKDSSE